MSKQIEKSIKLVYSDLINGTKLFQERAKQAFPYLVSYAKAGETMTYSQLAKMIGMPNARNLNHVLGAIGNPLEELRKLLNKPIPPITCVIVNKETGYPGNGISWDISMTVFASKSTVEKRRFVKKILVDIQNYDGWDLILEHIGLSPIVAIAKDELEEAGKFSSGGESKEHKDFKNFIATHPEILDIDGLEHGKMEEVLPSADRVDVVFERGSVVIGVEVKSEKSGRLDIIRGIFQCVKYKYLIEARQIVENQSPNSRVILALQGSLPKDLILTKELLGVEVRDNIQSN